MIKNIIGVRESKIDAVFFDCDGTLSKIEGIDYLASFSTNMQEVASLTALSMGSVGLSCDMYQQRLELIRPARTHLLQLAEAYYAAMTQDLLATISILQSLGKEIYVISAGNAPAVTLFAEKIGIPASKVMAVELFFDDDGNYVGFDEDSPLVTQNGKSMMIRQLRSKYEYKQVAFIGDGMNDVPARDEVDQFIGYGAHFYRKKVKELSDSYVVDKSMFAVLSLLLTRDESLSL